MSAETPTATTILPTKNSNRCPKCGTIKKSGLVTCCAHDGAWYKNCGDVGFDHTWFEGEEACKSGSTGDFLRHMGVVGKRFGRKYNCGIKWSVLLILCLYFPQPFTDVCMCTETPTAMTISPTKSSDECPKCGTMPNSGQVTCCARGGAWFKKCGDFGDTGFDYTWAEGVDACKSKSTGDFLDMRLL